MAKPLSPAQLAQRRAAGAARYRQYLCQVIRIYLGTGPAWADHAAQHLTGARRSWGLYGTRGVTSAYMERWAAELGCLPAPAGEAL